MTTGHRALVASVRDTLLNTAARIEPRPREPTTRKSAPSFSTVSSKHWADGSEIYVANANGTGLRQVTHRTADAPYSMDVNKPAWSPDGKRILFRAVSSAESHSGNLYSRA
jgi:Tol biopolymer transport system component